VPSLRFDAAGLGDSDVMPGRAEGAIYSTEACADIGAAISMLEARGYRDPVMFGHCSGAYTAFHATLGDKRIAAQMLINLQVFVWGENDTLETVIRARRRSGRELLSDAWRAVRQPAVWARLIRGEKRDREVARALLARALGFARDKLLGWGGRLLGARVPVSPIEGWFRAIDARGVRTLMVYSAGDDGLIERDLHLGEGGRALDALPTVRTLILPSADHVLSSRDAQDRVAAMLSTLLAELRAPRARPAAEPSDQPRPATATPRLAAE
jgi:hypothetical protein